MPKRMRPESKLTMRKDSPIYQVIIHVGDPRTGKRIKVRRSTHETNEEAAKAVMREIENDVLEELYAAEKRTSSKQGISDFIEEYFQKHGRALSEVTKKDYRSVTDPFVEWFGADTPLSSLTRSNCEEWVLNANTPSQRHKRYREIKAILNEAILDGKLDKTPISFRPPVVPENERDIFRDDNEFAKFWLAMEENSPRRRDIKNLVYLMSATGLRDGEAAHLERDDFDFESKVIRVRNRETHKLKNRREHTVPITPRVEDAFRLQMENKMSSTNPLVRESPFLFANSFGNPYVDSDGKARPVAKIFREQRKRILPNRPRLNPKALRHTVGQNAFDYGVPLRDITMVLNHKSEAITAKHYARVASYRKAEKQFGSIEEYLRSLPLLSIHGARSLADGRESINGSLTALELSTCNNSEVSA